MNFFGSTIQPITRIILSFPGRITHIDNHIKFWKSDSLSFILSFPFSVQRRSISADITFSRNFWVSCVLYEGLSHQTRRPSTAVSWINSPVFLASLRRLIVSMGHIHLPNLCSNTLDVPSRMCSPFFAFWSLRIFRIIKFWFLF